MIVETFSNLSQISLKIVVVVVVLEGFFRMNLYININCCIVQN